MSNFLKENYFLKKNYFFYSLELLDNSGFRKMALQVHRHYGLARFLHAHAYGCKLHILSKFRYVHASIHIRYITYTYTLHIYTYTHIPLFFAATMLMPITKAITSKIAKPMMA